MTDLDKAIIVLSIIREADNAPSFSTILNRGNFVEDELLNILDSLKAQGLVFSLDGDEGQPLNLRRFLTPKESKQTVDNRVADYLAELAGEGRLYFAYGANLNPDQMYHERCPGSHFLCRAQLEGYRLVFNKSSGKGGGIAGLEKSSGDSIWGVIYCLPENGPSILDQKQNQEIQYRKIRMAVKTSFGILCCDSYRTVPEGSFLPSRQYLEKMSSGAQFFGLHQQYLRWLVTLPTVN
ncbi:gamma-glutamylcyclotransferase family protein [Desulforamulus ruminis]|uniref:AIG2 family protein n=1 Tax=Desulforamulus ruminis (strain ATCC 23193 / DSM 2154 / NCIMB 8452 / DL) TaxID=696281 RepID=F6DR71_DESRL|nr:gamma-glutamylcyclotransferase family protein [Desulforamulus ruminis]AEG60906.1 AIG2 family protein [Desulforamulus ruminis DSM 2154]